MQINPLSISRESEEIELKLRVEPQHALDVFSLPVLLGLTKAAPATHDLISVYYDTEDYALLKDGMALRVREENGHFTQTVKRVGTVKDGVSYRGESDAILTHNALDLEAIADPALHQKVVALSKKKPLVPLFTTTIARTTVLCEMDEANHISLCVDQGEVSALQAVMPISEIELELVAGKQVHLLFQLAADIANHIEVALDISSKAWQGYRLHKLATEGKTSYLREALTPAEPRFFLAEAEKYFQKNQPT